MDWFEGEEEGIIEGMALGLLVGSNELDGAFVGEIVGSVLGTGMGGRVGEEAVKTSGQFNGAESPTHSSMAPLLLVAVLSLAAAATVASSLPLLFDKMTPNPMMSTKMAVPATIHPIRYNFWLGAGWMAG